MNSIRTDLALEARELYSQQGEYDIPGVKVDNEEKDDMIINRVNIDSVMGEQKLGKPKGNYITIEAGKIKDRDPEYEEKISYQIAQEIKNLVHIDDKSSFLIVGLGNWNITADSLGPKVVDRIMVTRHILELMPDQIDERVRAVSAVAPGVLGITGIETGEIIKGIVEKVKPDFVIAIDALASRRTDRIGTTIQIADTGINPGSGIGNNRMGLSKETLGAQTIAIGVPTVVYAHTIGRDSLKMLIDHFSSRTSKDSSFYTMLQNMDQDQLDQMVGEVLSDQIGDLVVTPKDVDVFIDDIAGIISDGLNLAMHKDISLDEINTFLH